MNNRLRPGHPTIRRASAYRPMCNNVKIIYVWARRVEIAGNVFFVLEPVSCVRWREVGMIEIVSILTRFVNEYLTTIVVPIEREGGNVEVPGSIGTHGRVAVMHVTYGVVPQREE